MYKKSMYSVLGVIVGLSVLAGCGNVNSIFRTPNPDATGVGLVTDSKQRAIVRKNRSSEDVNRAVAKLLDPANADNAVKVMSHLSNNSGLREVLDKNSVVCAEPSPDVAQALSTALELSAQVSRNKVLDAAASKDSVLGANISASLTESVVQLGERLAVIQLLRDKMYRACEAYANGAISNASYTLILARLDKTMTTLLSAEMAAGAYGRPLASAGGSASTAGADVQKLAEARENLKKANDGLKAENKKIADAVAADPNAKPDTSALQTASANVDKAVMALLDVEFRSMATMAKSTPTVQAVGLTASSAAQDIAGIHSAYLNDSGIEPLIDACLTEMSRGELSPALQAGYSTAKKDLITAQAAYEAKQEALSRAQDDLGLKKVALNDAKNNVREWLDIARQAEQDLRNEAHDEAVIATQMATGELNKAQKALKAADADVSSAENLVANVQTELADARQTFEQAANEAGSYQSSFQSLCDDVLRGGIFAKLIDARKDYQAHLVELKKEEVKLVEAKAKLTKEGGEIAKLQLESLKAALATCEKSHDALGAAADKAKKRKECDEIAGQISAVR